MERRSTPAQITEIMESQILAGELEPGMHLREVQLAEAFGVSRNTVREALGVLERQGLVRHVAHRGAEVTKLTEADVNDLFEVRSVLELAGVAASNGDAGSLAALGSEVDELERAAAASDGATVLDHDLAFHRLLVARLGSSRLDAYFESVQRELRLALAHLDFADPTPQVDEHRAIVEAISKGDQTRAQKLVRDHLETARRRLARSIGEK